MPWLEIVALRGKRHPNSGISRALPGSELLLAVQENRASRRALPRRAWLRAGRASCLAAGGKRGWAGATTSAETRPGDSAGLGSTSIAAPALTVRPTPTFYYRSVEALVLAMPPLIPGER